MRVFSLAGKQARESARRGQNQYHEAALKCVCADVSDLFPEELLFGAGNRREHNDFTTTQHKYEKSVAGSRSVQRMALVKSANVASYCFRSTGKDRVVQPPFSWIFATVSPKSYTINPSVSASMHSICALMFAMISKQDEASGFAADSGIIIH